MTRIRLLKPKCRYEIGTEHEVIEIIPHGGWSDSEKQYGIRDEDGTIVYVLSDNAVEI